MSYFVGFASTFYALALVCFVQLVMCIIAEWHRMKAPSLLHACRITTQKLLYFVVFLASIIRGAYFTSPVSILSCYCYRYTNIICVSVGKNHVCMVIEKKNASEHVHTSVYILGQDTGYVFIFKILLKILQYLEYSL